MTDLTSKFVVEELREFLDKFMFLDDFQRDDVFFQMTVLEIRKVIILAKHLENFKKRVSWKC